MSFWYMNLYLYLNFYSAVRAKSTELKFARTWIRRELKSETLLVNI